MISELNERSRGIFRVIVDSYMETGAPVGSQTISQRTGLNLSPATIRNVMAELETAGLLFAPHTSAGRMPTQQGLRLYIDGLMEFGDIGHEERAQIEANCVTAGSSLPQMFEQASLMLSGLSAAAGLVIAPKTDKPIKHLQFVPLHDKSALIVIVTEDGMVENRVMDLPFGATEAELTAATNYLNSHLIGRTLSQAQITIQEDITLNRSQLDALTLDLVQRGLAISPAPLSAHPHHFDGHIIVKGQSHLLNDLKAIEDLERARNLLAALEEKELMARLLQSTQNADGVQIFIGAQNSIFNHSGWSMILSPYKSEQNNIIGAIGVIGPLRLNYSRIIPLVDYTSKVMGRLLDR
jgi:heat-inducible transcriptional repressor